MTCAFSTSQLPKMLLTRQLLPLFTSKPAALASLLFDHPETQIMGKNTVTFLPFRAPASSFLWLFLFSDLLSSSLLFSSLLWLFPPLLFHLSIVSEVWLLNFLRNECILTHTHTTRSTKKTYENNNCENTSVSLPILRSFLLSPALVFVECRRPKASSMIFTSKRQPAAARRGSQAPKHPMINPPFVEYAFDTPKQKMH